MKVTTRDIAKAAGVSQSTVSLVLNHNMKVSISPETRANVLRVAKEMGYRFQKRAKLKEQPVVIGLLLPTLVNLYYPILAQNVEMHARSLGITVVLQNTMRSPETETKCFNYLRSIGAQGILCLYSPKVAIPEDLPAVIIGEKRPGLDVDTISLNSYAAGRLAADHLLSLGHREIAFITTPLGNVTEARRKRLEGARSRMAEAGLQNSLHLFVEEHSPESDNFEIAYEFDCGARLTREMLRSRRSCTAIIAVNDMTAMGCIAELQRRSIRIPEEIAICGFDNLYTHLLTKPELTTIDQMAFHGCKVGLSVLREKMNSLYPEAAPVFMEYQPRLYVRASTKADSEPAASPL